MTNGGGSHRDLRLGGTRGCGYEGRETGRLSTAVSHHASAPTSSHQRYHNTHTHTHTHVYTQTSKHSTPDTGNILPDWNGKEMNSTENLGSRPRSRNVASASGQDRQGMATIIGRRYRCAHGGLHYATSDQARVARSRLLSGCRCQTAGGRFRRVKAEAR